METKTVNLTPTWVSLVPVMLEIMDQNRRNPRVWNEMQEEFRRMAEAADLWNEHCRQQA